jgi:tetratricopeptide (TPR) repeat protein
MSAKTIHFFTLVIAFLLLFPSRIHPRDTTSFLKEADSFWDQKISAENVDKATRLYKKALALDTDNYEVCWKIARAYFSLGDRLPDSKENREIRKKVGIAGMKHAKKALELNPQGLEGHYYYALCLSQYSIGIGSVMTVIKGLGSQYEQHMYQAFIRNKYYDQAGPLRALGRYWYYLPWPKKDLEKSIQYLQEAIDYTPQNVRGYVYLAESNLEAGEKELAKKQLQKALHISPDFNQEVDAKRWKERAQKLLSTLQ